MRRTPRLISRSDPDLLTLGMLLRGHGTIDQSDRQGHVPAAEFVVYDATRPSSIGSVTPAWPTR